MIALLSLHALAAVIWVGGMFFAHQCLRPAAADLLPPPQRLPLWRQTLARFFMWVWPAIILLPVTGYAIVFSLGGFTHASLAVKIMHHGGWLMIVVFLFVFFLPFRALSAAVNKQQWPQGGKQMNIIRHAVTFNMLLGLALIAVAVSGRYW